MQVKTIGRAAYFKDTTINSLFAVFFGYVALPLMILPLISQCFTIIKRSRDAALNFYYPLFFLITAYLIKVYLFLHHIKGAEFFSEMRQYTSYTTEQNGIAVLISVFYVFNIINIIYTLILIFRKSKI